MPLYTYEHPENGKTLDLIQSMNEDHVFIDDKGVKWNRVFYAYSTFLVSVQITVFILFLIYLI